VSQDPFADPRFVSWAQRMRLHLVPKLAASSATVFLAPPSGDADIEQAVQLGLSIMMGKPLILVVVDEREVPDKLRAIADAVIVGDLSENSTREAMAAAIERFGEP
jgi:hypothetical protein